MKCCAEENPSILKFLTTKLNHISGLLLVRKIQNQENVSEILNWVKVAALYFEVCYLITMFLAIPFLVLSIPKIIPIQVFGYMLTCTTKSIY